jgi:hypothetical protein
MQKILKLFVLFSIVLLASSNSYSQVSVGISIRIAPPALPVYVQPVCPTDGYLWSPGYWAYGDDGYYWVPGVWVAAPTPGYLWTPGYWGYTGGYYGWHGGYWGTHVGFYGGMNYGFGYGGVGFGGGMWQGGSFRYNTAVMNVNTTVIHNTYVNNTVINNTTVNNHASFNGPGGVTAVPTAEERVAMTEHHVQPTASQVSHEQTARSDKSAYASVNHGRPANVAMNTVGGHKFNQQGAPVAHNTSITPHNTSPTPNHNATTGTHPINPSTPPRTNQTVNTNHPQSTVNNNHTPATNNVVKPVPQHQPQQHVAHRPAPAPHPQPAEHKKE